MFVEAFDLKFVKDRPYLHLT